MKSRGKSDRFRRGKRKTKSPNGLRTLIERTEALWKEHGLDYDEIRYVTREIRRRLNIERPNGHANGSPKPLTTEEVRGLLDSARTTSGERGLLVLVLLESGARVSEFVTLKSEDFLAERSALRVGTRLIPLSGETAGRLAASLKASPRAHLFQSNRNLPFTPRRIQQIVREVSKSAGIDRRVHPHLLRRTMAGVLLDHGADLGTVREFLGHERIQTTKGYAAPANGRRTNKTS